MNAFSRWTNYFLLGYLMSVGTVVAAPQFETAEVKNAIIYLPLGKAKSTQLIFDIRNTGDATIILKSVSTKIAKKIILVPQVPKDTPNAQNPWALEPAHSLKLNSEKYYIQLNELTSSLSTGDDVAITLSFSDGKQLLIIAKAKSYYDQKHSE